MTNIQIWKPSFPLKSRQFSDEDAYTNKYQKPNFPSHLIFIIFFY